MISKTLDWLDSSSCNFMAIATMERELKSAGFNFLNRGEEWNIVAGGKYYTTLNASSIFAFIAGSESVADNGFRIIAAHSDSPCLKIKPNAEIYGDGGVVTLNVEKYGGGILYTWFDRPLSIAGRVMIVGKNPLRPETKLVDLKRAVATIPHLAIHFNRGVNEGNPLSVQKDMKPVLGFFSSKQIAEYRKKGGVLKVIIADELGITPEDILEYELALYPVESAKLVGVNNEYFQSGRIDDLSMAFAALESLLNSADKPCSSTRVMAIFDNEETGSGTKQGAASPVLRDMLERISISLSSVGKQNFYQAVENSFMISADDAHAWHPNYNEKYDPTNHPVMGGGPVIKINANCKYMTDAESAAIFRNICREADVKCQYFVNHSDVLGGSTLGNILTSQIALRGVDMGNAIWGMHSARETASVSDQIATVKVFTTFFTM